MARGEKISLALSFVNLFYALIGSWRKLRTACLETNYILGKTNIMSTRVLCWIIVFETKLFMSFIPQTPHLTILSLQMAGSHFSRTFLFKMICEVQTTKKQTGMNVSSEWVSMRGRITISLLKQKGSKDFLFRVYFRYFFVLINCDRDICSYFETHWIHKVFESEQCLLIICTINNSPPKDFMWP